MVWTGAPSGQAHTFGPEQLNLDMHFMLLLMLDRGLR